MPITQTISVNATPTVIAITSSSVICTWQNAILTANGATTYTWSPGIHITSSYTVTPTSITIYTLTGLSSGCKKITMVSVSVNPLPVIVLSSSNETICLGNSTIITATSASSYAWNPSIGLSSTNGNSVTEKTLQLLLRIRLLVQMQIVVLTNQHT